jgi:hypothetical protein
MTIDFNYIFTKHTGYVLANVSATLLVGLSINVPCHNISVMAFEHVEAGVVKVNNGLVASNSILAIFLSRTSI